MDASNKLLDLLKAVLEQLPSLLTLLGCMAFAIARWKRHPKVSFLALVGLGLLFLYGPIFSAVFIWVPALFIDRTSNINTENSFRNVFLVLSFIYYSALTVAFALLLVSIFMQRGRVKEET